MSAEGAQAAELPSCEAIAFTRHAVKRARKRFRLRSDAAARHFLFTQLNSPAAESYYREGVTTISTPAAVLITRPMEEFPNGVVILTCFPPSRRERKVKLPPTVGRPRTRDRRAADRAALRAAFRDDFRAA